MPVLVVEDTSDLSECFTVVLESAGYIVYVADNGRAALRLLQNGLRPSIILLDLMMPEMDGFQFRTAQLADPYLASIPVIVYSGHPFDARTLARLGAVAYMQKPLDPDALLDMIAAHRVPRLELVT